MAQACFRSYWRWNSRPFGGRPQIDTEPRHGQGNDALKRCAVPWLRGEYSTITEAKEALKVSTIIDDGNIYESFKLLARLVRIAGYSGLVVTLDEMTSINRLKNSRTRRKTHEQLLDLLNNAIDGTMSGIGFVMCGTPEFVLDDERGLFSYKALKSRLNENYPASRYPTNSFVLPLPNLTPEESLVLFQNIRMLRKHSKEIAELSTRR